MKSWIVLGFITLFYNIAATVKLPQFYVSEKDVKVDFSTAVKNCHSLGMRLLGSSANINSIFTKFLQSDLSEENAEFWFLNLTLDRPNDQRAVEDGAVCQKISVQNEDTEFSVVHSDMDLCSALYRYICEKPRRETLHSLDLRLSAYNTMNYQDAKEACISRGLQLVHVENIQQNNKLTEQVQQKLDIDKGLFWIGTINLDQYENMTGSSSNAPYEGCKEIHQSGEQDCIALAFDGTSNTSQCLIVNCDMELRFVCEKTDSDEVVLNHQDQNQNWSSRSLTAQDSVDWFRRFVHGVFHGWS